MVDATTNRSADVSAARPVTDPLAGMALTEDAFLGERLLLQQPASGYRAGIDAVLLAAAAPASESGGARVLDAGAGVGTVGLCIARRRPEAAVVLVERNPALAALAARNAARTGLAARVATVEADLLAPAAALSAHGVAPESFDVVVANPPYHDQAAATASADPVKAGANAMPAAELDQWVRVMARVCRAGGRLALIHKASALPALLDTVGRRFGAIEVMPVHPRAGETAGRIIVRATKGSCAPLQLLPGFVVHDAAGGFTAAAEAILRHGAALDWPAGVNRRQRS